MYMWSLISIEFSTCTSDWRHASFLCHVCMHSAFFGWHDRAMIHKPPSIETFTGVLAMNMTNGYGPITQSSCLRRTSMQ